MLMLARHLLSIAILPFTVAVVVPVWLARSNGITMTAPQTPFESLAIVIGVVLLLAGFALFVSSLRRFATDGKGTLAPWDPPRRFVVTGPYRFVRNPMISGVITVLLGEAAILRSAPHLIWAVIFFAANAVVIPLVEEPQLRARFGEPYEEYCRHVGRLIPRVSPWSPGHNGSG